MRRGLLGMARRLLGPMMRLDQVDRGATTRRGYAAANRNRLNGTWGQGAPWPSELVKLDAALLRARTYQLYRDNASARALVNGLVNQILTKPMVPRANARVHDGVAQAEVARFNGEANELFRVHGHRKRLWSLDGRTNFAQMQRMMARCMLLGGEFFLVAHYRQQPRRGVPEVRYEVVGTERLDTSRGGVIGMMGRDWESRPGIETDLDGRPVRYWFRRRDGVLGDPIEVPADRVYHGMVQLYPGQDAGEPIGAAVGELLWHFGRYYVSEVQGQESSAATFGWIRRSGVEVPPEEEDGDPDVELDPESGRRLVDMGVGRFVELGEGEDMGQVQQVRPGGGFQSFVTMTQKMVCAAFGLPYEKLSGDYSGVNFSTSHKSEQVAQDAVWELQLEIEGANRWFWESDISLALLQGDLRVVRGLRVEEMLELHEQWPTHRNADPVKQANADRTNLETGETTLTEIYRRKGRTVEDMVREMAEERERFARAGLPYPVTGLTGVGEETREVGDAAETAEVG